MLAATRILRCILFVAITTSFPFTSMGKQKDRDTEEISIEGRVTDGNGLAIFNADVILAAQKTSSYSDSIFPNGMILAQTRTDANGQYRISIRKSDPRLVGNQCSVFVRSQGFSHKLEAFAPCRLLVDYPMDFHLSAASLLQLQILDENNKPLEGIRVAPAFIGEKQIPFNVADLFSEVSDRNGIVTLNSARPSTITSVYATPFVSINPCHQCIEVKHNQSIATATLMPILRARGKVIFDTNESTSLPTEPIRIGFVSKGAIDQINRSKAFSWCDSEVDVNGNFDMAFWTGGRIELHGSLPFDFPFVLDREQTRDTILSPSGEIVLKFLSAKLVRGRLVDADSDQGFDGGFLDYFDCFSRPAISQADGSFQFWSGVYRADLYPMETFGEAIAAGDGFYKSPESLPVNGVIDMKPLKMRSMTTALGCVINEQGQPVPGVSIKCQSKLGRFDSTTTLLSDRNGNFRFFGLPEGIWVSISAHSGTLGTKKPVRIKLTNDSKIELVISEIPYAHFAGRIVDNRNNPVADAAVSIKTAITSSPETISGLDRHVVADEGVSEEIITDVNGYFLSLPITSVSDERTARVDAPGYIAYRSGWHRPILSPSKDGQPRMDLGTIQLKPQPEQRMVTIRVVDRETSMPILGAAIATLGSRCGHSRRTLTDASQAELIWVDTPKIMAVRAEGYIPSTEAFASMIDSNYNVQLTRDPKNLPPRVPTSDSVDQQVVAAEELLALVPEPSAKDTYFKKLNYYPLLGFARPEKLIDKFEADKQAGLLEVEKQAYMQLMSQLQLKDPKRLLQSMEGTGKAFFLMQLAEQSQNETERSDYLAEAAVEMRQVRGDENTVLSSRLACVMLKLGMKDMAERLLRTIWDNHKELRDIVKSDERLEGRHNKQGISRYFAPELSIVDPFAAMKLIELTAYANEIERLQAEAICFVASQGIAGWDSQVERLKTMPTAGTGVSQFIEKIGFRDYERAMAVARAMPPSTGRTKLLMHIAEKCNATHEQRLALFQETLQALRHPTQANTYESLGILAGRFAKQVGQWDKAMAEEFLFEAIWQSAAENSWLPYSHPCDIATELARFDANLATTLVSPCFEDWSWLFGDLDHSPAYNHAPPILAMASIDSIKAVAKVKELFSGELADQPSRKLSVVNGIVSRWRVHSNGRY